MRASPLCGDASGGRAGCLIAAERRFCIRRRASNDDVDDVERWRRMMVDEGTSMRILLVLLIAATSLQAADFSVGFGQVDVTPKLDPAKPVYIAGFGHGRTA